jgi:hypothetical protein
LAFHSGREAAHSPPSCAEVGEWVKLCLRSPNAPSWRGAQLGGAQGQLDLTFMTFVLCNFIKSYTSFSLGENIFSTLF